MSKETLQRLEARIAELEQEMGRLKIRLETSKGQQCSWLDRIAGSSKDDPYYDEFLRELKKNRDEDYRQAAREAEAAERQEKAKRKKRSGKNGPRLVKDGTT